MSHSTFVWNRVAVSKNFCQLRVEFLTMPADNRNSNLSLSDVKKDLSSYHANNYLDCPLELWQGATYENKPIIKMLAYIGKIGDYVTSVTFIIYTRNE